MGLSRPGMVPAVLQKDLTSSPGACRSGVWDSTKSLHTFIHHTDQPCCAQAKAEASATCHNLVNYVQVQSTTSSYPSTTLFTIAVWADGGAGVVSWGPPPPS